MSTKIILRKEKDETNEFDHSTVTITTDAENLNDLFNIFEDFIKGIGYTVGIHERVGLINENEINTVINTLNSLIDEGKSFIPIYLKSKNKVDVEVAKALLKFMKKEKEQND